MTNKKFNIRTLNKLFNQSGIEIIQGNGYCYFTSSNNASEEIKNKIASLYNSSVPINKISSISYNEWMEIFNILIEEINFDIDTYRYNRYNNTGDQSQAIKHFMFIG